jgi:hypothetical protein
MSVDAALQSAISSSPQCVAAGYVDLVAGVLLGIKTLDAYPTELLDFLAVAGADMFQGPSVVGIERAFDKARGLDNGNRHYFQEILVTSDHLVHVFLRSKKNQNHASCFVYRKSMNIGLAMTESRAAMLAIEAVA